MRHLLLTAVQVTAILAMALPILFSFSPVAFAGNPITFEAVSAGDASTGVHVQATWRTGDEFQTAGYLLYRSDQKDGPYGRINPHLIPAATDVIAGGHYRFVDLNVQPGQTYYYRLHVIDLNGESRTAAACSVQVPSIPSPTAQTISFSALEGGALAAICTGAIAVLRRLAHG